MEWKPVYRGCWNCKHRKWLSYYCTKRREEVDPDTYKSERCSYWEPYTVNLEKDKGR